jgi:hypothetical protein
MHLLLQYAHQSARRLRLFAGVCSGLCNPDVVPLVVAGTQLVSELLFLYLPDTVAWKM